MADLSSIARPYALAAFEYARDKQQLPAWKAFLESAKEVAQTPSVARLLENPEVSSAMLFDLFSHVLVSLLDQERKNFLLLLAQNKRFIVLPDIAESFNAYYAAYEKTSSIRVVTAVEVHDDFRKKLEQALAKRIQREVTLHCEIDPDLLGGAVIHIGDRVIDGSIRGKLTRLLQDLAS
ncbi:F0F1 ATP synthase subunit delta [Aquicella lusitana]|uniref:ATP synthase subunit delta n=1 Tax=Aquicella lusitana TaxID=254246 RepID=A0A370GSU9_9COXI|nr:F0F1 ATP synthase subunit delta [Aquicella lusitana]RDI46561.1 ATP synthase F1 subcomplex delta subunit [Aquicella lusitana]VVC74225.1 ATP synthase subunit delta [Aquicella lusitana]